MPRVTSGNTPDMWRTDQSVVTERRPGTYIYFDRMQVANGAASWDDCALTVLATVVSRPTPNRVVIDAGSKSLSSDLAGADQPGYGLLMGTDARHRAAQRGARDHRDARRRPTRRASATASG